MSVSECWTVRADGSVTVAADWESIETDIIDTTPPDDLRITRGMLDEEETVAHWTEEIDSEEGAAATGRSTCGLTEYEKWQAHRSYKHNATISSALCRPSVARWRNSTGSAASASARPTSGWIRLPRDVPPAGGRGRPAWDSPTKTTCSRRGSRCSFSRGKRAQVLTLLSGGETAMVAIARLVVP